ncbi:Shugoshin [Escovopsis weberi]|uniref:Shugoshin n=1 Tax=Escovopsis weberi TaxID=150374 RepID=A0A0M9VWD8_ESCWE|nr:Shugoshin [Escovopsis weberi]
MARLNEVPVAPESLETLKRKIFRQNRDLARSNNVRALRIKELENNCACMLTENLELRARVLELERLLEDNETRRIADHALAIKAKLEAQLEEWGGLIAGLGLELPAKRQSPECRASTARRRRTSFLACRPSPSQRRLRDVAKDIEELGHISENKLGPRRSMNPEQILALRSEADISIDSMELGPPPTSHYLEGEPGVG